MQPYSLRIVYFTGIRRSDWRQLKMGKKFKNLYYELYHQDWTINRENKYKIEKRYKRIIRAGKKKNLNQVERKSGSTEKNPSD